MPEALTYLLPIIALLIGAAATYIFLKNSVISNLQRGSDEKSLRVNELESNLENMRNERDDSKGETIRLEEKLLAKEEDLASQKTELVEIQKQMNEKFKLIAAEILDNNSRKIQEQHETKLKALLDPLKERIKEFEKKVNPESVVWQNIETDYWKEYLKELILEHSKETKSNLSKKIIDNFDEEVKNFIQVCPKEMLNKLEYPITFKSKIQKVS